MLPETPNATVAAANFRLLPNQSVIVSLLRLRRGKQVLDYVPRSVELLVLGMLHLGWMA